jgi:hypothetical protein
LSWQRVFQAGFQRSAGQNDISPLPPLRAEPRTIWAITHDKSLVRAPTVAAAGGGQHRPPASGNAIRPIRAGGALWLAAAAALAQQ